MPTYDYRCNNCSHEFELFQSMKDAPKRKCPKCGKNALERLIGTGAAIMFKGSGFYETDYRSDSYKKAADADKPASESKSESKPDSSGKDAAKPAETKASESKGDTSKAEPKKTETPAATKAESKPASKPARGKK